MQPMKAHERVPELTHLNYPCYVIPIMSRDRFLYIPGSGTFKNAITSIEVPELEKCGEFVLEGFIEHVGGAKEVIYWLDDAVPVEEWYSQRTTTTFETRLKRVNTVVQTVINAMPKVMTVPFLVAYEPQDVVSEYKACLQDGYEGVNLKFSEGVYTFDKTTADFSKLSTRKGNQ